MHHKFRVYGGWWSGTELLSDVEQNYSVLKEADGTSSMLLTSVISVAVTQRSGFKVLGGFVGR